MYINEFYKGFKAELKCILKQCLIESVVHYTGKTVAMYEVFFIFFFNSTE